MIRFLLGVATGIAAAWSALAIWQRFPPLGPIDPDDEAIDDLDRIVYLGEYEPRRGDRRPGFDDSVAGGSLADVVPLGARRIPPMVHRSDCALHIGGLCTCGIL